MRVVVCLHAAAAARASYPLHPADERAIEIAVRLGAEVVVLESVAVTGSTPIAVAAALEAGAHRAMRIVDETLASTDAHTAGFAVAAAIERLQTDLVLFGAGSDPEGTADVPGSIARHMAALYLTGVEDLVFSETATAGAVVDATLRTGGHVRRLRLRLDAVVGIAAPFAQAAAAVGTTQAARAAGADSELRGDLDDAGDEPLALFGWSPRLRPFEASRRAAPLPAPPARAAAPRDDFPTPPLGAPMPPALEQTRRSLAPSARHTIQVLTLGELGIDPALVRRRDDLRGAVEPVTRPLTTLESAAALAGLIAARRSARPAS